MLVSCCLLGMPSFFLCACRWLHGCRCNFLGNRVAKTAAVTLGVLLPRRSVQTRGHGPPTLTYLFTCVRVTSESRGRFIASSTCRDKQGRQQHNVARGQGTGAAKGPISPPFCTLHTCLGVAVTGPIFPTAFRKDAWMAPSHFIVPRNG